jgi:hypothetical protein
MILLFFLLSIIAPQLHKKCGNLSQFHFAITTGWAIKYNVKRIKCIENMLHLDKIGIIIINK